MVCIPVSLLHYCCNTLNWTKEIETKSMAEFHIVSLFLSHFVVVSKATNFESIDSRQSKNLLPDSKYFIILFELYFLSWRINLIICRQFLHIYAFFRALQWYDDKKRFNIHKDIREKHTKQFNIKYFKYYLVLITSNHKSKH